MICCVFTYGTLEIPEVIEAVTGRSFAATPARLKHYARFLLADATYPGIVHDSGSEVEGVLYWDIDRDSLVLLDRFEADFYRRETVRVVSNSHAAIAACAYVVPPTQRGLLSNRPWDRDHFIEHHLADFLVGCRGLQAHRTPQPDRSAGHG
jgi:gamma-glutamylcyclotransferase (GGCT)/AIG2-like uncharacterized protein YtfP